MEMFDTVAAARKGAWLHLTNMQTGMPAYLSDDAPCRINLHGMDSPEVRRRVRHRAAGIAKSRGNGLDISRMTEDQIVGLLDDAEANQIMDAVDATVGWENLTKDGETLEYSEENAVWLYGAYPSILREVLAFLKVDANFFEKA